MQGRLRWGCGALLADGLLSAHVPTFACEFADRTAPEFIVTDPVMPLGAFHASELPFVFQPNATAAALAPAATRPIDTFAADHSWAFWAGLAA